MRKILVVDDSKTVRIYHREIIKEAGYTVEEAENGMEANEKIQNVNYDMYLVDINMPVMDGYSFVEELRKKYKTAPVIMISTEAEDMDRAKAYEAGSNLYFIKPVKPDILLSCIKY
ncbi:MAG: response regulator [Campylobacterales bacterium]|nr:response regulator [Campylobacterales bacterium]